jgi:hypothetical protein
MTLIIIQKLKCCCQNQTLHKSLALVINPEIGMLLPEIKPCKLMALIKS